MVTVDKDVTDDFVRGMANGVPIIDGRITKKCTVVKTGPRPSRLSFGRCRVGGAWHCRGMDFWGWFLLAVAVGGGLLAAAVLADNLGEMGFFAKTFAVVGMLADKDIAGTLAALGTRVDHWLPATLAVPRGATAVLLSRNDNRITLFPGTSPRPTTRWCSPTTKAPSCTTGAR
jgi:hypothetical protein